MWVACVAGSIEVVDAILEISGRGAMVDMGVYTGLLDAIYVLLMGVVDVVVFDSTTASGLQVCLMRVPLTAAHSARGQACTWRPTAATLIC